MRRPILLIIFAVVVLTAAKGGCSSTTKTKTSVTTAVVGTTVPGATTRPALTGAAADVKIAKCTTSDNEFLGPVATLTVTNNSSGTSNYLIQVTFVTEDGATQIDTATAVVNTLAPGQNASVDATSFKPTTLTHFVCRIAHVTRYAS